MIETNIGQVVLQPNQVARLSSLHDMNIKGFFIDVNGVVVKSENPINNATVISALQALDNSPIPQDADKTEFQTSDFHGITPAQADTYIVSNVTNLASAITVLRKMARVLIYLIRRSDLQ